MWLDKKSRGKCKGGIVSKMGWGQCHPKWVPSVYIKGKAAEKKKVELKDLWMLFTIRLTCPTVYFRMT